MSLDYTWFDALEAKIPHGEVRTRFAPSPTGYMHVGNLRTALYTYLIARHAGGKFILRIEDTDQKRKVEDAVAVIKRTMDACGLDYDEGPDVGGPVAPYVQTERQSYYKKYAELLVEKKQAYRCFCSEERLAKLRENDPNAKYDRCCCHLTQEEIDAKLAAGEPYVIRQLIPEGTTTFSDAVYGDITVDNAELEDQVLLKSDGLPTYNFANVIDDHLMGITHVVRGSEYLSSAPKYNLLYEAFGWEIPTYVHCASVMIADGETGSVRKMSKRHGDPSYEDLVKMGYLSPAVVNYVALLGWSPKGELAEQEFFTMPELIDAFEISGISKSPSAFDLEKLKYFNSTYLKAMAPEAFLPLAEPYIRMAVTDPDMDAALIAPLIQTRIDTLADIPDMVAFFACLPEYDVSLYANKKNKLTPELSRGILERELDAITAIQDWTYDAIHDALYGLAEEMAAAEGAKLNKMVGKVMWPIRIAAAGKTVTPGGAVEICQILGKEETIRRVRLGLEKLAG
ncbi:MAG: glutamate--tRNA ligase [Oscillospiraceae bacterium]|nr:glutamate--tRNA ligase [Oscillospiraceae bacterium]